MTSKRRQMPMEGLVDPEEIGPGEHFLDISDDVQGHGLPIPAPPADFSQGTRTRGGELDPGDSRSDEPIHL